MLHNQVLNAIPRQKVKFGDRIWYVLGTHSSRKGIEDIILQAVDTGESIGTSHIDDCEPVPEEPRPLRVGDSVRCKYPFGDHYVFGVVTAILHSFGDVCLEKKVHVGGSTFDAYDVRLATPQERKDYFLND